MPNFPIKLGSHNGGNSRIIRGLSNGIIKDAFAGTWWWVQQLDIGDFTGDADGAQALVFSTVFPNNPFPTNVVRKQPLVYVRTPLSGGAVNACTIEFGDANDPNGLLTSTSVFTGASGFLQTTAAAEFAPRFEAAFSPTVDIATTNGNISALTAGSLVFMIAFTPAASV